MSGRATYHRVLLDLCNAAADRGGIRIAAELARLLDLDLTGVFIEDAALLGLAGYSFARELRLPGHQWHALDPGRIAEELRAASDAARRRLDAQCAPLGIRGLFEVVRGDPGASVAALSGTSDIVVLVEPATPSERLARAFPRSWQSALRSAASVLLVPPRIARYRGPVAAVVTRADNPALATAAAIAVAAGEHLLLLLPPGEDWKASAVAGARAAGLPVGRIQTGRLQAGRTHVGGNHAGGNHAVGNHAGGNHAGRLGALTAEAVLHALGMAQERLLVLTRDAGGLPETAPSALATVRRVPVLLVEPDAAA